jgi:hypothetical protein
MVLTLLKSGTLMKAATITMFISPSDDQMIHGWKVKAHGKKGFAPSSRASSRTTGWMYIAT